jgi:hypothetical protein
MRKFTIPGEARSSWKRLAYGLSKKRRSQLVEVEFLEEKEE